MADQGGTPTKPRKTLRKKGTQAVSPLAEASPKSAKGRGADPSARVKKGSGAKGLKGEAAGTAMMGWNLEDGAKEVAKKTELMANPGLCLSDLVDESMLGGGGAKLSRASKPPSKAKRRTKVNQKQEEDDELAGLGLGLGGEDYGDKEDDGDVEASARLLGSLQQLATEEEQAGEGFERRRSQVQPESEFHAGMNDDEITVEDLLAPMQAAPSFGDMRRQLEGLAKREAMAEPVSEVKKGREERAVQYDATSKDVRKWYPQVHRMQRADQVTLGAEAIEEKSTSGIVSSFTPVDDFERELQEVTRAAGVTEEDVRGAKALPMNPRIREEQQTRQVARLKALMLREQQSSKRVKKIKSKTYRRIHRKNDSKDREVLLERLEHENPELAKQLKQEYEKKHAQNRLLRNRNARKKWTQTMQRFAKGDANAQQEITKQAQKAHDEERSLKRAIRGQDQNDSDSENIDLSGSEDEAGQSASKRTISKAKKLTLDEIRSLDEVGDLPTSGFLGMKFMREAIKTKRESAKQEAQAVLKEIEGMEKAVDKHDDYGDSDDEDKAEDRPGAAQEAAKAKKVNFTEEELAKADKEVDEMLENEDNTTECTVSGPLTVRGVSAAPAGSVLSGSKKGLKGRRSGGLSEIAPETPATPASSSRPASKKIEVENPWLDAAEAVDEGETGNKVKDPSSPSLKPQSSKAKKAERKRKASADNDLREEEAEAEARGEEAEAEDLLGALSMDTQAARDQRELVRTAFVEGTQEDAFEDDIDEADRLKEEKKNPSADLPGWGSWAGEGAPKPREPKGKGKGKGAPAAAVPARAPRGSAQFYEGKAEAAKYFVDKVPYGVQSPEQYDQQLRMPTGPEWNALPMHLQRIKPKIFVKVGTIVPPLMLVKHLPPERREGIMDSWAKSKQPKRLKSRV